MSHRQRRTNQIEITPTQAKNLTTPQPRQRRNVKHRMQRMHPAWRRNAAVCSAVHTATGGRSPVARHTATRASVHTTARGRRSDGNSTHRAGLLVINPRRIAPFSAARSTSRIRCKVIADNGRTRVAFARSRPVNIACTRPIVSSASATFPRPGLR